MTNIADNAPSSDSKSARAALGSSPSPYHNNARTIQSPDIGFSKGSRLHNMYRPLEDTTFVRHDDRELTPAIPSMSDMRFALPGYQSHAVVFDRCVMPQHFIPTESSHGTVCSSVHPFPLLHERTLNKNMHSNNLLPQEYSLYSHHHQQEEEDQQQQQQQQEEEEEHIPPQYRWSGYQSLGYSSPAHLGTPPAGYGQICYTPPIFASSHGQSTVQANMTTNSHPHCLSHSTQEEFAKVSANISNGSKLQSLESGYDVSKTIVDGSTPMKFTQTRPFAMALLLADVRLIGTEPHQINSPSLITPRGPPRKPKQSGHALWVGNLPPGTDIDELKDYFAQDATKDVESVFLISKSNCAFVNYKTEIACLAALSRFHDTRFYGARLVCRLRRGSMFPALQSDSPDCPPQAGNNDGAVDNDQTGNMLVTKIVDSKYSSPRIPTRYFIIKSLSKDDLELSRQSGIWATQAHNEGNLNQAYQTTDNVYLIFSANKSGEYYGYARMMSLIQEDDDLVMEMPPRPNRSQAEPKDLNLTPTPATSTAPNGRIINDLTRGTVFWEADSSEDDGKGKIDKSIADVAKEVTESGFQSIGKPFRIQWLSTEQVPFHRTRGLRNPWNANREIKIARDGTEIEPAVGERLVQLFHTSYPA
ncbi:YT521-B-like domain-containing protein [Aspergillus bertholletiae]|uniref:YT521-B-like domain-containing protein n=1 Tax=Aspergillus bertholletiae TaxID=1226010 RepID=A0A5N7B926_9EURO|nr:YT521-B-like domain-containing protein [Aspergillus bertholletiae]